MSLHKWIRRKALHAAKALCEENEPHALEHRQRAFVRVDLNDAIAPKPNACRQDSP